MTSAGSTSALASMFLLGALGCTHVTSRDDATRSLHGELGLNDVSILFPLPEGGDEAELLGAASIGRYGEILPYSSYALAPAIDPEHEPNDIYQHLRVVSARIDPCFPSLEVAPSPSCRFQVRLVLQPLYDDGASVRVENAAIHLFYDLPVGAFVDLVGELLDAQHAAEPVSQETPLGVHPTLAAEGLDGDYAQRVKRALSAAIGKDRMTRLTFAALGEDGAQTYGGFDFADGVAKPLGIMSSSVTEQRFTNTSPDPLAFSATLTPALANSGDDLTPLFDSSSALLLADSALDSLYSTALRIENPHLHSSASIDCASCHVAQPARLWLERHTTLAEQPHAERYASNFDLSSADVIDASDGLRAFGWQGDRPSVNQRVVNESAAVAAYLNQHLLR